MIPFYGIPVVASKISDVTQQREGVISIDPCLGIPLSHINVKRRKHILLTLVTRSSMHRVWLEFETNITQQQGLVGSCLSN